MDDMKKKEYQAPELKELGDLTHLTQSSWQGDSTDGVLPEDSPEFYGS